MRKFTVPDWRERHEFDCGSRGLLLLSRGAEVRRAAQVLLGQLVVILIRNRTGAHLGPLSRGARLRLFLFLLAKEIIVPDHFGAQSLFLERVRWQWVYEFFLLDDCWT
jgi:hypothetical protein